MKLVNLEQGQSFQLGTTNLFYWIKLRLLLYPVLILGDAEMSETCNLSSR